MDFWSEILLFVRNLIYTWRHCVCMKNKDSHTKRLLLKKNFLVLKHFLAGGSCLIWYRRHEDRPASCWFRRKSWKYLGDTRMTVKSPFGQAFLKLCSPQLSWRLCQLGYSVLFIIFTDKSKQHNVQQSIHFASSRPTAARSLVGGLGFEQQNCLILNEFGSKTSLMMAR